MFTAGFEKTANKLLAHLSKHRKDYLLGTAAIGSLGTAIGANRTANKKR